MKFTKPLYFLLSSSAAHPIYATVPTHNFTQDQQENTTLRCTSHELLKELYAFPYLEIKNSKIQLKEEKYLCQNEQIKLDNAKKYLKENNYKNALTIFEKLAKKGSAKAIVALGKFYKEQYPMDAFNYFALAVKTEYLLETKNTDIIKYSLNEIVELKKKNNISITTMDYFLNNEFKIISNANFSSKDKFSGLLIFYHSNYMIKNITLNHSDYMDQQILRIVQLHKNDTIIDLIGRFYHVKGFIDKAAFCFRLSQTTEALWHLGALIFTKQITFDEKNEAIKEEDRYQVAARLLRSSNKNEALWLLALMIIHNNINHDEKNEAIKEEDRYQVAARLLRQSNINEAKYSLADLILKNQISCDENNIPFNRDMKFKVAARLCRESQTNDALYKLGCLIFSKAIKHDEKNIFVEEKNRLNVSARLLSYAPPSKYYYELALLELVKINEKSEIEEVKKIHEKAKEYILKAIDLKNQNAVFFLEKIQKNIDKLKMNKTPETKKDENNNLSNSDSSDSDEEDKSIQNDLSSTISKSSTQPVDLFTEQNNSNTTEVEDFITPEYKEKRKKDKEFYSNLMSGKPLLEFSNPFNDNQQQKSLNTITWDKKALDQLSKSSSVNIKLINVRLEYIKNNELSRAKFERLQEEIDLYSVRITQKDRLKFKLIGPNHYEIRQCMGHD